MSDLDKELEDTMEASDPTAASQPGNENEPVPSSGFPEQKKTWLDRVKDKLFNK